MDDVARYSHVGGSRKTPPKTRTPRKTPRRAFVRPAPSQHYLAFLSYSHADEELAAWLHEQLEEFRVPRRLVGKVTEHGPIPRRLKPIFRDQGELAASDDLTDEIEEALAGSRFLVVLCSPAATRSRWTNREIETFKRYHPEGCILAAVVDGEPFASEIKGREEEESFPPALRQKFDRLGRPTGRKAEPLAADLRQDGDERRVGFLKLVAGMLGVGLDELIQRETTRRHRRLAWITAASLIGMLFAIALAVTAIQARDAARDQRREAEGLVAFMVGDLKDKLEPIGKLDALDGVGQRVLAYYDKQDASQLSDAGLRQRSQALSLMGQVANLHGNSERAKRFYRAAMAGTAEAIRRNPRDPQRLFEHAQNVFWVGSLDEQLGDREGAEAAMREYKSLADRMLALEPDNLKWRMEEQNAQANLGFVLFGQRKFAEAAQQFARALPMLRAMVATDPRNGDYQKSLNEVLAWLADAKLANGEIAAATRLREEQVALLYRLTPTPRTDADLKERLIPAEATLGRLYAMAGQRDRSLQHFRASLEAAQSLIATEPNNTNWLNYQAGTRFSLAKTLLQGGRSEDAAREIEAGCTTAQSLLERDPRYTSWQERARGCWLMRARLSLQIGRSDEAVRSAKRAVSIAAPIRSSDPVADRFGLSEAYLLLGDAERSRGNGVAAAAAWATALRALPSGVAEKPTELDHRALVLERVGRVQESRAIAARLSGAGYHRSA